MRQDTAAGLSTPTPFSIRLSAEERRYLEQAAGDMSLAAYIRAQLFKGDETPRRKRRSPVKDHQALGHVLGSLGNARIANNLNQLAKAANMGALPVTPETEKALQDACQAVQEMRIVLMMALWAFPGSEGSHDSQGLTAGIGCRTRPAFDERA